MVDAIDLAVLSRICSSAVLSSLPIEIAAERLFENEPSPVAVLFFAEAILDDLLRDIRKKRRRRRQIKKEIVRDLCIRCRRRRACL